MNNQLETWKDVNGTSKSTLLAEYYQGMVSYQMGYVDEKTTDRAGKTGKPFLPGYYKLNGTGGYDDEDDTYAVLPEKVAGVDSTGIAQGALSALKADYSLKNIKGQDLLTPIDTYYAMSSADSYGLGADGKPVYQRTDTNSYDDITRLSPADIEKNTVIVPDVRLSQAGDLLVKTEADGSLHIGVIVGYRNKPTSTSATLSDWMKSVLVVSTRAGFRMSNLGVWGNDGAMFGGFSEEPEQYIIRRWLLPTAGLAETGVDEAFPDEVINTLHFQRYTQYVEEGKVPYGAETVGTTVAEEILSQIEQYEAEGGVFPSEISTDDAKWVYLLISKFIDKDVSDYREMPPTTYSSNRVASSVFNDDVQMKLTNYTGWRHLTASPKIVKYHRGLDISTDGSDLMINAPEGGKYWVLNLETVKEVDDEKPKTTDRYIQIDDNNFLIIEGYSANNYGDIGVLVTNPDNPRKGRVYLFAHQYYFKEGSGDDILGNIGSFKKKDGSVFTELPSNTEKSWNWKDGAYVDPGDFLGYMDNNYYLTVGKHIHMEVYEYFPDCRFETEGEVGQQTYSAIKAAIEDGNGISKDKISDSLIKSSANWQRIDPRTVFKQNIINNNGNRQNNRTPEN